MVGILILTYFPSEDLYRSEDFLNIVYTVIQNIVAVRCTFEDLYRSN